MAEKRRDKRGRVLRTGESQRPDGRYVYKYIDSDGKQKFLYSWRLEPTDSLPKGKRGGKALREKEADYQRDKLNGLDHAGSKMTVLELYQKQISLNSNVRENTKAGREHRVKMLENDALGFRCIANVRPSDAKEWAQRMKSQGMAYNTIRSSKIALRAAFALAVEEGAIQSNPFDFKFSNVLSNDTERKPALTPEQEQRLLEFLQTDTTYQKYYDDIVILLGTGLRISELCGLTVNDIDMENRTITVGHQLLYTYPVGLYIEEPKTKHGTRQISMSKELHAAFQRVLDRPRDSKAEIDGYSGFLFCNQNGQPRTAKEYECIFRRLRKKHAKLYGPVLPENMTPHTLRHTFCTRMANSGIKPKLLQYIMGHSSISITMDYYADLDGNAALAEMQRILESSKHTT